MLYFDDCVVPKENILVAEDGFRKLLPVFNIERLGNTTRSLALAQACFDRAVQHAKERQQFGRPICEFQGLQWKVADMKMKLDAGRLLLYRAAVNAQQGMPSAMDGIASLCGRCGLFLRRTGILVVGVGSLLRQT